MADKEIFQNVNEIDLEALTDNNQAKKKNIYMSHDKVPYQHVYCTAAQFFRRYQIVIHLSLKQWAAIVLQYLPLSYDKMVQWPVKPAIMNIALILSNTTKVSL